MFGLAEVARHLEVDARRAARITRRPGFPAPTATLTSGRVWRAAEVRAWAAAHWPA